MVAEMRDRFYAEFVQLLLEYNPQPPFNAGSPATAPSDVVAYTKEYIASFVAQAESVATHA